MKNINLMPRIPREKKLFFPILLLSGVVMIAISVASMMLHEVHVQRIAEQKAEVEHLNASVQALMQQKMADPLTNDFKRFSTEVQKLKSSRTNWQPVLELLVSQLPEISRLTQIEASQMGVSSSSSPQNAQTVAGGTVSSNGQTVVKVKGEFTDLVQISEYVLRIQQSALVENAVVKNVDRVPADNRFNVQLEITLKPEAQEK